MLEIQAPLLLLEQRWQQNQLFPPVHASYSWRTYPHNNLAQITFSVSLRFNMAKRDKSILARVVLSLIKKSNFRACRIVSIRALNFFSGRGINSPDLQKRNRFVPQISIRS